MKYLSICLLVFVAACATYDVGAFEPVPGPNHNAATWGRDNQICQEKLSQRRRGKGAYRFEYNDCMKRLGQDVDWRATEEKYKEI